MQGFTSHTSSFQLIVRSTNYCMIQQVSVRGQLCISSNAWQNLLLGLVYSCGWKMPPLNYGLLLCEIHLTSRSLQMWVVCTVQCNSPVCTGNRTNGSSPGNLLSRVLSTGSLPAAMVSRGLRHSLFPLRLWQCWPGMLNNVSSYTGKFPFLSVKSEFHDSALLCPFTRLGSQELELSQV